MMIDYKQIRAARALLGWRIEDLANNSGVPYRTIQNIESNVTVGRVQNVEKIQLAFEEAGVEFLQGSGLKLRDDRIKEITGENCYIKFMEYCLASLQNKKDAFLYIAYANISKSSDAVLNVQKAIIDSDIDIRWICKSGIKKLPFEKERYRVKDTSDSQNIVNVISNDFTAFYLEKELSVIIVRNIGLALQKKIEFIESWNKGKKP